MPLGISNMILATFIFTLSSSSSYSTILHLNLKCLHDNYIIWGPSTCICISLMNSNQLMDHRLAVASAVDQFIKNSSQFSDLDVVLVLY